MTLKSFEELEFLLNDEERKAFRKWKRNKAVLAQRPNYMTTQQRIMPYLPKWMKKKVIDARELFDAYHSFKYARRGYLGDTLTIPPMYRDEWYALLEKIQQQLLEKIEKRHIAIECNPSSNYKIGEMVRYD